MTVVTYARFRVAVAEEAPGASFTPVGGLNAEVPRPSHRVGGVRRSCVEYYRAVGGLPQRALLGGTWAPDARGVLRIDVHHSELASGGLPTCAGELGHPLVPGLPREYGSVILATLRGSELPSGHLTVDRAAHDLVESSEVAFRAAAVLLVAALGAPPEGVLKAIEDRLTRLGGEAPGGAV